MGFMKLKTPKLDRREKLKRMDWTGNLIFIASSTSFTVGITWAGSTYSWSAYQVLVPLLLGIAGLCAWIGFQKFSSTPTIPFRVLTTRTSAAGYWINLVDFILLGALTFYLPVYFEGPLRSSTLKAGLQLITFGGAQEISAIVTYRLINHTQSYRGLTFAAWGFQLVSLGFLTLLTSHSPIVAWFWTTLSMGLAIGAFFALPEFAVLAPLPPSLAAPAITFLVVICNLGITIGVAIGGVIVRDRLSQTLPVEVKNLLSGDEEITSALISMMPSFDNSTQELVRHEMVSALRILWLSLLGIGATGLLATFAMEALPLHAVTDSDWGLQEEKSKDSEAASPSSTEMVQHGSSGTILIAPDTTRVQKTDTELP